jgi:hypothetical protein
MATVVDRLMATPAGKGIGQVLGHFAIGAIAGFVSVFMPRMMLLLSVDTEPAPERYITLFNQDFLWLGVAFSILIGVVCAILEFGAAQEPRVVFMTALGLPALISGVLNTTSATNKLERSEQERVSVLRNIGSQEGIPQQRPATWEPLSSTGDAPDERPPARSGSWFLFASPAFAQSPGRGPQPAGGFDPGIQVQRPGYVVTLKRAGSEAEALRQATELQKEFPAARAVKTDQGFFVVDGLTARSESEALLTAIKLKSRKDLAPSLLQVPRF